MPLIVPTTDHQKWRLIVGSFVTASIAFLTFMKFEVARNIDAEVALKNAQRQAIETTSTAPQLTYYSFPTPLVQDADEIVVQYTKPGIKNGTFLKMRLLFQNANGLRTHTFNRVTESTTVDEEWRVPKVPAGSYRVQIIYEITGTDGFTVPLAMRATSGWRQP